MTPETNSREYLKQYFGYDDFRPGQADLVAAILQGQDCLGIMPTGAGKSICFQIPALMLPGITLVISPLISLMKDQVGALGQAGIPAAYLNSSLSLNQMNQVLQNAKIGKYKLIYIAPERLFAPDFLSFAQSAPIDMITVDEAHCISQWGQDFRPSYTQIPEFVGLLSGRPIISAFTATATQRVQEDIATLLNLQTPKILVTGFDRQNLFFEVQQPQKKLPALLDFLSTRQGESGIIYCNTRKNVESVCDDLNERGFLASRYHAGLADGERRENQDDFLFDRVNIMVATNAFGMGIDKSNVSFVVHYNMPKDMESYYQEAGRGGRDGSPAHCLLLYSGQDVMTNRWMITQGNENENLDPILAEQLQQRELERLRQMTFYATLPTCLRSYILKYFGETPPTACNNCGNCTSQSDLIDVTQESQKVLSCVIRMGNRYGAKLVIDVLRGSKSQKILDLGLDHLSTYGISQQSEQNLRQLIDYLLGEGYLIRSSGDYPILSVSETARPVLRGETTLSMRQFAQRERKANTSALTSVAPDRQELYQNLVALRKDQGALHGVPPYAVFEDKTLVALCAKLPTTQSALLNVPGIGQQKAKLYGQAVIDEIAQFCDAHPDLPQDTEEAQKRRAHRERRLAKLVLPTPEILAEIPLSHSPIPLSALLIRINDQLVLSECSKLTANRAADWLTAEGYLEWHETEQSRNRIPTPRGKILGLTQEARMTSRGWISVNLYPETAQKFVIDHVIDAMKFDK